MLTGKDFVVIKETIEEQKSTLIKSNKGKTLKGKVIIMGNETIDSFTSGVFLNTEENVTFEWENETYIRVPDKNILIIEGE